MADNPEEDTSMLERSRFDRTDYLMVFEQRFVKDKPEKEILHNDNYWTKSIPHEQSGPCETYDPPSQSDPGYEISMFLTLKELDTNLDIFLHERNKFFFSKNLMSSKFTKYLNLEEVKKTNNDHTRIIGMSFKTHRIIKFEKCKYESIFMFPIEIYNSLLQLRLQRRQKCRQKTSNVTLIRITIFTNVSNHTSTNSEVASILGTFTAS